MSDHLFSKATFSGTDVQLYILPLKNDHLPFYFPSRNRLWPVRAGVLREIKRKHPISL